VFRNALAWERIVERMQEQRIYGIALLLSTVGLLATAGLHPTAPLMPDSSATIERFSLMNKVVHGLALGSVWLSLFGVVGLSRSLGFQRPDVIAALTAFAMAAMMITFAAVMDGLVASELARRLIGADDAARQDVVQLMRHCFLIASSLTRFYVVAASAAIALWSVAMLRAGFSRVLPWVGFFTALLGFVGQFSGYLRMNTHDLMLMVVGQGVWIVWTGLVMIRRDQQRLISA
jgi:hypothetical protein